MCGTDGGSTGSHDVSRREQVLMHSVQRGGAEGRGGRARSNGYGERTIAAARRLALALIAWSAILPAQAAPDATEALLLTGTVEALYAQKLRAPRMDSWRMQIQWMAEEGSRVDPGDPVVRIDSANLASEIEQLELQLRSARQRAQKELADLEVALLEAERSLAEAEAKRAGAALDAGVPAEHLPAIQYERYQLDARRAETERDDALAKRDAARAAIGKRRAELDLEERALNLDLERKRAQLDGATLRAERAGAVLYASDRDSGNKLSVGANVQFNALIAQVTVAADLVVVAALNEVDALRLPPEPRARITLDARPDRPFPARVVRQTGAAEAYEPYGSSRYFELTLELEPPPELRLVPGMSVLVEIAAGSSEVSP